jgi:putative transcriptional regulator
MEKQRDYIWRVKLGEILRERGITQTEFAKKTGLRQATISELVCNTRTIINKTHLSAVMNALDLTDVNDILEVHVIER